MEVNVETSLLSSNLAEGERVLLAELYTGSNTGENVEPTAANIIIVADGITPDC